MKENFEAMAAKIIQLLDSRTGEIMSVTIQRFPAKILVGILPALALVAACNKPVDYEALPLVRSAVVGSSDKFQDCIVEQLVSRNGKSFGQRTLRQVRMSDKDLVSTFYGSWEAEIYRYEIFKDGRVQLRLVGTPDKGFWFDRPLEKQVFDQCVA